MQNRGTGIWCYFAKQFPGSFGTVLGKGLFLAGSAGMPGVLQIIAKVIGVVVLVASREFTMRLTALINPQPLVFVNSGCKLQHVGMNNDFHQFFRF